MDWIPLAPSVVGALAAIAAWRTLNQKINSDDRTEWWKRYAWVEENTKEDRATRIAHFRALKDSPLATESEKNLIAELISKQLEDYDGQQHEITSKGGQDDDQI